MPLFLRVLGGRTLLLAGVFVEILFEGKIVSNSIQVPESAVYNEKYVYILKNNKPKKVNVKVEGYINNQLIISGDFIPGSLVILTRLDSFQGTNNYYSITK